MTDPSLAPSVLASLSGAEEGGRVPPRWYSHAYNRAELYRLAAATGWAPRPPPGAARGGRFPPRWSSPAYNRPELYRLAAAMGWLPRPARLGLARVVGRGAGRLFPGERAVVRGALGGMTAGAG